ncbi:MAG: DUF1990 family protein [Mycobacteriales bacterium]
MVARGPVWFTRPAEVDLDYLLAEQAALPVSYQEVGMVCSGAAPGYRRRRSGVRLGVGEETFGRAVAALGNWEPHTGAGFELRPRTPVDEGATVVLLLPLAGVYITVACRVVYLISGDDRWGFAYGTLPHHLERGEESFVVERDARGAVYFVVESLSRPASPLARLGFPVTSGVQCRVTRRYLSAMAAVAGGGPGY